MKITMKYFQQLSLYLLIVCLLVWSTPSTTSAAVQKLSDLSYTAYTMAAPGTVVIDTTGHAKLRISFCTSETARVQIAPSGSFSANPSPAVVSKPAIADVKITDGPDQFLIQSTGLLIRLDKKHLSVDAYDPRTQKAIIIESPENGTTWDLATGEIQHSIVLTPSEHLYGLGQDNSNKGTLDRRGTYREMWTGQQIRSGNVTADYPIPFYLSTGDDGRGYGCFVDNSWHMKFDLGKSQPNRLSWTSPGGPIDYYIFNGPSFKKIIDQYTQLTGRPSMLPLWAFGFWQSRCFYESFSDIEKSSDRLQADGVPLDVMVVDSAWDKIDVDFKWSDKFLEGKSAQDWIAYFHDRGLKIIVSTKGPMIKPEAENYAEAMSLGLFATDGNGQPMTAGYYGGHLMDFTSPNMQAWLTTQLKPLTAQGVDGWWLDLNEPEGEPPQAVYHEGKSADIHNTFSLRNYRAYYDYCLDVAPQDRPVILGRAATAGTQRYSSIVWTGDVNSDWPTFRAHIPEAQNTGMSGLPYWTNDSGGFLSGFLNNDRYGAHAELYQRWFEFSCFAPIARAHKAGPSEPFEYGPEVEATAKKYLQLRYRMMPYIYSAAHEATTTGLPMLRPLVLEYQNDPGSATAKTEYLFGSDLLVAPIIWAHTTARPVYFPPGNWISLDDGYELTGGKTIGIAAPRDRLPLFVKAGAILPQAPAMTHTSEKNWDPITLEIWPHETSTGSLYQDDFTTNAFEHGESTATLFTCVEQPGQSVLLTIKPTNTKFGPKEWITKVHLTSVPQSVSVDGHILSQPDWSWDASSNLLIAAFAGNRSAQKLEIKLDGSSHPRPAPPHVDVPDIDPNGGVEAPKQIAQFLPPPKLPIRIEAANFDKGGENLAYHVAEPGNPGNLYRSEGVPIVPSTDSGGGYSVSGLKPMDWLAYTIDAGNGGWFEISARVLPGSENGVLSLLANRTDPLTLIPFTGQAADGKHWISVSGKEMFQLPPGEQILTVRLDKSLCQIANLTFTAAQHAPEK